jgi:hypothetical protein
MNNPAEKYDNSIIYKNVRQKHIERLLADTRHIFSFAKHAMTYLLCRKTSFERHENRY